MNDLQKCKIISIKKIGKEKTYNLTMKSKQHNYAVYDEKDDDLFVISKNSIVYSLQSYICAYLKANYVDEFMCCYLNVENRKKQQNSQKKVGVLIRDLKVFNIELLPKDINVCNVDYEIVKKKDVKNGVLKTQIRPAILCKGIGIEVAEEIVKKRPYTDLRSLAYKTDKSLFTKESLGCLIDEGFFDNDIKELNKGKKKEEKLSKEAFKEMAINKFDQMRQDRKKSSNKGVGEEGLFE